MSKRSPLMVATTGTEYVVSSGRPPGVDIQTSSPLRLSKAK